jgi:hypothetical protein
MDRFQETHATGGKLGSGLQAVEVKIKQGCQ